LTIAAVNSERIGLVAGGTRKLSWRVLKPGGLMVSTLGEPEIPGDAPKGARSRGMVVETKADQLSEIGNRAATGKLRIEISKVFPLTDPADAHQFLEHGHFRGKIAFAVG
jgi:NADPH:quinone reductase-like Zn-dependent oxidoreductase